MDSSLALREYIRAQYGAHYDTPALMTAPWRTLGLESMQWIDLVLQLERRYALTIPDAVIGAAVTLADLCGYIDAQREHRL